MISKLLIMFLLAATAPVMATTLAQVTHYGGKVLLNGNPAPKRFNLKPGLVIQIQDHGEEKGFAHIAFQAGHRMVLQGGRVKVEKLEENGPCEISLSSSQALVYAESPQKKYQKTVIKLNTKHGVFKVFGGNVRIADEENQASLDVLKGKVVIEGPWGDQTVFANQGAAVSQLKPFVLGEINAKRQAWVAREFRKIGLRAD